MSLFCLDKYIKILVAGTAGIELVARTDCQPLVAAHRQVAVHILAAAAAGTAVVVAEPEEDEQSRVHFHRFLDLPESLP